MTALDTELEVLAGDSWQPDRFTVVDERTAEHALRRIREARADLTARTATAAELIGQHEAAIAEMREFVADETAKTKRRTDHFEGLLIAWHHQRWTANPKGCVSIRLSGGTLKSQAGRDTAEVVGGTPAMVALARQAEESGADFARFEPKVDRRKLLAWIKATGEVPDGARLVRATADDRTFKVEVPE